MLGVGLRKRLEGFDGCVQETAGCLAQITIEDLKLAGKWAGNSYAVKEDWKRIRSSVKQIGVV